MPRPRPVSNEILEAALAGLEAQKQQVDEHIAQIHRMIPARAIGRGIRKVARRAAPVVGHVFAVQPRKRRVLSPEARQRIAAAQRRRWAAVRKAAQKAK